MMRFWISLGPGDHEDLALWIEWKKRLAEAPKDLTVREAATAFAAESWAGTMERVRADIKSAGIKSADDIDRAVRKKLGLPKK